MVFWDWSGSSSGVVQHPLMSWVQPFSVSTALTVSIKAQQPVNKLALSQSGDLAHAPALFLTAEHHQVHKVREEPAWCPSLTCSMVQVICLSGSRRRQQTRRVCIPCALPFDLGGRQHFVFAPLMQLRITPYIILANFRNLENVESNHSYFCLFFIKSCTKPQIPLIPSSARASLFCSSLILSSQLGLITCCLGLQTDCKRGWIPWGSPPKGEKVLVF